MLFSREHEDIRFLAPAWADDSVHKVILIGCGPLSELQGDEFQDVLNERFGDRKEVFNVN